MLCIFGLVSCICYQ